MFYELTTRAPRIQCSPESNGFVLSKDRRFLLSASYEQVELWRLPSHKPLLTAPSGTAAFLRAPVLAIASNNTAFAIASLDGMAVRDLATGELVLEHSCHGDGVLVNVAFIPGTTKIVVASTELLQVIDTEYPNDVVTLLEGGVTCMAVSRDGRFLAKGMAKKPGVELYEFATGATKQFVTKDWVSSLDFSTDGRLLATGNYSGHVSIMDATNGRVIWCTSAPGRYRPSWIFPATKLVLWIWGCQRLATN